MTDLRASSLAGRLHCRCGTCRPVRTLRTGLDRDLAARIAAEAGDRPVAVIGDPNTLAACGAGLASALNARGGSAAVLDTGHLHADQDAVDRLTPTLGPGCLPVAIGSGTLNDVVKAAAHSLRIPYVAVATAASMNGYTSAIAAITVEGLKRTLPSTPPVAVYADPDVLAAAPPGMAVSGIADLLSKPVSGADWKLSHILWGDPYCPAPSEMAESAVAAAAARPGDSGILFDALLVSGFSMACAGSSSPASGGEHLISHYLDMTAASEPGGPREPALHGEQVGVATATTTRLYRQVLGSAPDWRRATSLAADPDGVRQALDTVPWIPERLRALFLEESLAKLGRTGTARERIGRIEECWSRLGEELAGDLRTAERYRSVLATIGAPCTPEDLGVSRERYTEACRLARWVRDRYSILDLAGDLGMDR
mgnify:CR=1 FL=1